MAHFRAIASLLVKSVEERNGVRVIEGTATKTSTDSSGDVIESKGAVYKLPIPLLVEHNRREPVGEVTAANVTSSEIRIRATIAPADAGLDYVERAWRQLQAGLVKGLSIGARPLKAEPILDKAGRQSGVRYTSWRWHELSAVVLPMHQDATISNVLAVVRSDYARLKERDRRRLIDQAVDAISTIGGGEGEQQRRARIVAASLQQRTELTAAEQRELDEVRARAIAALEASTRVLGTPAGARALAAVEARNGAAGVRARAAIALCRSRWALEDQADLVAMGHAAAVLSPTEFESHLAAKARGRAALRSADRSAAATMARAQAALDSASPAVKYQAARERAISALQASAAVIAYRG